MRRALVLAFVLAAAPSVRAQPDEPEDGERARPADPDWQFPIAVFEMGTVMIPPAIYYWSTVADQKEDWELQWNWSSWHSKLLSTDGIVLDTNQFMPNAVRHPITGALTYQIGRANGLGPWASFALDVAQAVAWEYFVEYREKVSANDIATNALGGILIGEPLFQLGRLADRPDAGVAREGLGWIISPFHSAQRSAGLSWLARAPRPSAELEARVAPSVARFDAGSHREELAFGLDLGLVRDSAYGAPGHGDTATGLAGWNRELLDLRFGRATDASGVTGARWRSETSYYTQYSRDLDELGTGSAHALGVGGGIELFERRLAGEWDRLGVFELVGPRAQVTRAGRDVTFDGEVAAYADVAMVQAHVFGEPLSQSAMPTSVLVSRGYYYATGATAVARGRVRAGRWYAAVDATAHQFWSFDDHDHGGDMDPKGVADQRVIGSAQLGVRPWSGDVRLELFGDAIARRGTWASQTRTDGELDAGLGLTAGF